MPVNPPTKELLPVHKEMLIDGLKHIFGEFSQDMLQRVLPQVEWIELAGGDTLFRQGESDTSLYIVISGRLRAFRGDDHGATVVVGDVVRGETVGEMAFFTGSPRSASIAALRDSMLAKFSHAAFQELLLAYPLIALNMTRLVIERQQRSMLMRKASHQPITLALVTVSDGVDGLAFSERLAKELSRTGTAVILTAERINALLGSHMAAQAPISDAEMSHKVSKKLEEIESEHQFVLFVADPHPSEWTRRCLRHCDKALLLANAQASPALHPIETACMARSFDAQQRHATHQVEQTLILLHSAPKAAPSGTRHWYQGRQIGTHFHLRPALDGDWGRLARTISGHATGLVLSGGGARGFAHLGVMKALQERGIVWDMAGGTSMGAVMASYGAMDMPMADVIRSVKEVFKANPTRDFNWIPLISLIAGEQLKQAIDHAVRTSMGPDLHLEDLWKPYFCVASNYSTATESVLTSGPLAKSIRASVSIPGVLPPVMMDGDLHIDGGIFNNFPTDVMHKMGAAKIIGVNLLRNRSMKYHLDEVPSARRLLTDKLRGRKHGLPSLTSILLSSSMMYSNARQKESKALVDLYFSPPVHQYGMLEWNKFDRIVQAGYEHACEELSSAMAESFLTALQGQ